MVRDRRMNVLNLLIGQAVERKQGNKEFALFRTEEGQWAAMLGEREINEGGYVHGEYEATGNTAERAVRNLLGMLPAH